MAARKAGLNSASVRRPAPVLRVLTAALVGAFTAPPALAQPAEARDVSPLLAPILESSKLPGIAAVVIEGDAVVAQGAAGLRSAGAPDKITINDRVHLGSCTKSMTATMIARLVEAGQMSWQTTVSEVFGETAREWDQGWHDVTVEQLVCHRAGVPGNIPPAIWSRCWQQEGTPTQQRMMLADALLRSAPRFKPGEKFEYANAGFAIAGLMAERVTGKAWEDLMREQLFAPLGITSAGFGSPGTAGTIDQPRGHRPAGTARGEWEPVEPGPAADNPPAIGPGGTIHMTLPDWARYVSAHVVGERGGSPLLTPETFVRLHTPPNSWQYGYGWIATRRPWAAPREPADAKDGRVITHNGSNTMWFCVVWAAPEREIAVLVATNAAGDVAAKACDQAASALIADLRSQATPAREHPAK